MKTASTGGSEIRQIQSVCFSAQYRSLTLFSVNSILLTVWQLSSISSLQDFTGACHTKTTEYSSSLVRVKNDFKKGANVETLLDFYC